MHAIIDLGTNTFHLLIFNPETKQTVFQVSQPAKIGMGGINQGIITEEGIGRALAVLRQFRVEIDRLNVQKVQAYGTSAIRNASNAEKFIDRVWQETQIPIRVISGDEEATLIYKGVRQAVDLPTQPAMIVDIGGGSVEFIIANQTKVFWKQSFEIGGQRLMETFMKSDPISAKAVELMDDFFRDSLLPLANACHQYQPQVLVGSSGSFDTLVDMWAIKTQGELPAASEIGFDLPLSSFYDSYEQLLHKNREERLEIAGMITLRVDMIVVAVCLIRWLVRTFQIQSIKVSRYALKEGVLKT